MNSILSLEGISVLRNGTEILRDVDWTIRRGEHWGLLGANGSGKTTLLKVLLTYIPATRGTIRVLGETHGQSDWRLLRRRVGLVSNALESEIPGADSALDVVYSGHEAMLGRFGARNDAIADRAMGHLKSLGGAHVENRAFGLLSQGERQRVLIGRAMMAEPELLILDEPCGGLDPIARDAFLDTVSELMTRPSPAIVFVTHHVEELPLLLNHVLLLRAGRVLMQGSKEDIVTSRLLSLAYGAPVDVTNENGRYRLNVRG